MLVFATMLLSSCGPAWKVIRDSGSPSALSGQTSPAVTFDYRQLVVDGRSLEQWMTVKTEEDPKYPESWGTLMASFERSFVEGLQFQFPGAHSLGEGGPGPFVLVVQPRSLGIGRANPFAPAPTSMTVALDFQLNGQSTDAVSVTHTRTANLAEPSVFTRLPKVGEALGRSAGQFLDSKQPEAQQK
ncbi:MAG: hypothetical protein U0228_35170 [Myxococcaceae bacterium]